MWLLGRLFLTTLVSWLLVCMSVFTKMSEDPNAKISVPRHLRGVPYPDLLNKWFECLEYLLWISHSVSTLYTPSHLIRTTNLGSRYYYAQWADAELRLRLRKWEAGQVLIQVSGRSESKVCLIPTAFSVTLECLGILSSSKNLKDFNLELIFSVSSLLLYPKDENFVPVMQSSRTSELPFCVCV